MNASQNASDFEHQIDGIPLLPGAGIISMAIEGVRQITTRSNEVHYFELRDVEFLKPVRLSRDPKGVETQLCLRSPSRTSPTMSRYGFSFYVYEEGTWSKCALGNIWVRRGRKTSSREAPSYLSGSETWRERFEERFKLLDGSIQDSELYSGLEAFQVKHGPAFRALSGVSFSAQGQASAKINLRQWTVKSDLIQEDRHIIHPAALDGLVQLVFIALSNGLRTKIPAIVPTKIKRLRVANLLEFDEGKCEMVLGHAESKSMGFRKSMSSIWAVCPGSLGPLVLIEGLETTAVTNDNVAAPPSAQPRQLCCRVHWMPDPDSMSREELTEYCSSVALPGDFQCQSYKDLDMMIIWNIKEALSTADAHQQGREPHIERYIAWMGRRIDQLEAEGFFAQDAWKDLLESESSREKLFAHVAEASQEGRFFYEVCLNLRRMLERQMDPLEFLFQGSLVDPYYEEVNGSVPLFEPFAAWLETTIHRNPNMKVLEIGAGTGGTTARVLKSFASGSGTRAQRCDSYEFTDISPAFLDGARDRFQDYHQFLSFKLLDIERDPASQGFEKGQYDLIIAADVLHATRSLGRTLSKVRWLLKPGGKLALFEITNTTISRASFAFGLLGGWWLSEEPERRWSPCLEQYQWERQLIDAGFSKLQLAVRDHSNPETHENSAMVATALDDRDSSAQQRKWSLVIDQHSPKQIEVAERLEAVAVAQEFLCQTISLKQAGESQILGQSVVISLLECGEPWLCNVGEEEFSALQKVLLNARSVLWICQDSHCTPARPHFDVVAGFARSLRSETESLKFVTVQVEKETSTDKLAFTASRLLEQIERSDIDQLEFEWKIQEGRLCIPRVIDEPDLNLAVERAVSQEVLERKRLAESPPLRLSFSSPGVFETFEFCEDQVEGPEIKLDEVIIQMKAIGIASEDHKNASGRATSSSVGHEGSGIIHRAGSETHFRVGDRVCLMIAGLFKSHVCCKASLVVPLPPAVSILEGAVTPTAVSSAYAALIQISKLQSGGSVLISSPFDEVGQMAIQIARNMQAEIFVSTGVEEDQSQLATRFGIAPDHILSSSDTAFKERVLALTNKKGLDIIFDTNNSPEMFEDVIDCLGPLGKIISTDTSTDTVRRTNDGAMVSWTSLDMFQMIEKRPEYGKYLLENAMAMMDTRGLLPIQPLKVFKASDVPELFDMFERDSKSGKCVVHIKADDVVPVRSDRPKPMNLD